MDNEEYEPTISRRSLLKVVAGAPLLLTFGLVSSPIARFLKPSMKPGGFFQEADMPAAANDIRFNLSTLPADWMCIPFVCCMKYTVFNPEQEQLRKIPAFLTRKRNGDISAYSRLCPRRGCLMNYAPNYCCGCGCSISSNGCRCALSTSPGPALVCPNGHTVFSLDHQRVVIGYHAPKQFQMMLQGDVLTVLGLELGSIA